MKCSCYHEYSSPGWFKGQCYGTKECEPCDCGGDVSKCDFYLEKRVKAQHIDTFNTAEMWIEASKDGETYIEINGDASYSKETGFVMENVNIPNTLTLSDWLEKKWRMQEKRKMTKAEAEKEFGIKIID